MDASFAASVDRLKESFLHAAAQAGNTEDCESLLEINADLNFKHSDGDTPLLAACRRGHCDTAALLIAHGADCNITGADSLAPIHICAKRGDANTLDVLLQANTNTLLKTKDGETALDIARNKGHEHVYALLMRQRSTLQSRVGIGRPVPVPVPVPTVAVGPAPRPLQTLPARSALSANSNSNSVNNNSSNAMNSIANIAANTSNASSSSSRSAAPTAESSFSSRLTANNNNNSRTQTSIPPPSSSAIGMGIPAAPSSSAKSGSNHSYSLISPRGGSGSSKEDEQSSLALKRLLDTEIAARNTAEAKLEIFAVQNRQLLDEFSLLRQQLNERDKDIERLQKELRCYRGERGALDGLTIEKLEEIERDMRKAMQLVEDKKAILIRSQIESSKEQRLCVICQEKEKSVVLLPCRHMCLCDTCAVHDGLDVCPLCRERIMHKISVFS